MKITVVTWNIHKGIGGVDRRYRIDRIVDVLASCRPDFALLQEVDEGARRSKWHRQVDVVGDALALPHRVYRPTHRLRTGGHYGNAVLSRWPIARDEHVDLTVGRRKNRGAVIAYSCLWRGCVSYPVVMVNLHLGLSRAERSTQMSQLLEGPPFNDAQQPVALVVAGDFNDVRGDIGTRFLEPAGFRRACGLLKTFPAAMPVRPLDAIYVRGEMRVSACYRPRSALVRVASDHVPIVANLALE